VSCQKIYRTDSFNERFLLIPGKSGSYKEGFLSYSIFARAVGWIDDSIGIVKAIGILPAYALDATSRMMGYADEFVFRFNRRNPGNRASFSEND